MKISGTEYKFGYKIPLAVENDAAIKFNIPKSGIMANIKIPGMPDTANAGMKIDYANAVDISPKAEKITEKSPVYGNKSSGTSSYKNELHASGRTDKNASENVAVNTGKSGNDAGVNAKKDKTGKVNKTAEENLSGKKETANSKGITNTEKTINEKNQGKISENKSENTKSKKKKVWPWVAGGVSGAVIIAAAVTVVLKRNGKI